MARYREDLLEKLAQRERDAAIKAEEDQNLKSESRNQKSEIWNLKSEISDWFMLR